MSQNLIDINLTADALGAIDTALGSDLMMNALEGYAVLKIAGKGEGLDGLRRMLSVCLNRGALAAASFTWAPAAA